MEREKIKEEGQMGKEWGENTHTMMGVCTEKMKDEGEMEKNGEILPTR